MNKVGQALAQLLELRHGDVWIVQTRRKKTIEMGWIVPLETADVLRWYAVLVVLPVDGWPEPPSGFYRSHLRYGDMGRFTEDEALVNLRRLFYTDKPNLKDFSKNVLKTAEHDLVWQRRVTTL